MQAIGVVKSVLLMLTICRTTCSIQHYQYPDEPFWKWARSFIDENDDVIFFNCGEHLHNVDSFAMRSLKHKSTFWSHQAAESLYKFVLGNIAANTRTIAVLPSLSKDDRRCLKFLDRVSRPLFLVDVVILNYVDNILAKKQSTATFRGRRLVCIEKYRDPGQKAEGHITPPSDEKIILSPRCLALNTKYLIKKKPSFAGSQVLFGCIGGITRGGDASCQNTEFTLIFEALRAQNATPRLFTYSNVSLLLRDLYRGGIDVLLPSTVMHEANFAYYRFPGIVEYRHDTFYVWKGKHSTSFTQVFLQSKKMALLMFLALMASWITFTFGRFIHTGTALDIAGILDVGGFLLASLLSTSTPIPRSQANASGSYSLVRTVWVIAIFPLSFYYRGELTSRLSIRVPPNPMDTLEELEAALDKRQLTPCFVAGSSFYGYLESEKISSALRLHAKIRFASKKSNGPRCVVSNPTECIRSCASKHSHACFMHSVKDCGPYQLGPDVVKSREPLRLALVSTAVRKDFTMNEKYGNLLSTIFETAINPEAFNNHWSCYRKHSVLHALHGRDQTNNVSQMFQLLIFFVWFSVLLLLSGAVFCAELAFGWKRWVKV